MPTDRRPELSDALKRLDWKPWFTWPSPALRLQLAPDETGSYPAGGQRAIIVKRGRFGLATVIEKDGLWAHDVAWIDGPCWSSGQTIRIQRKDVRALVIAEHGRG
jgi:hypothetical protein